MPCTHAEIGEGRHLDTLVGSRARCRAKSCLSVSRIGLSLRRVTRPKARDHIGLWLRCISLPEMLPLSFGEDGLFARLGLYARSQKSTRPRASDRSMCCRPGKRRGLPASETDQHGCYTIRMPSRWNHASSPARPDLSSHAQGLEGKEISSPSSRGRKTSLTSPLIDQAIALKTPPTQI